MRERIEMAAADAASEELDLAADGGDGVASSSSSSAAAAASSFERDGHGHSHVGGGASVPKKQRGKVKWFSNARGFGFITPDGGDGDGDGDDGVEEDLFVHQAAVHAHGFRSLQEGESVEYVVEVGEDGRSRAVSVTGPGGAYVLGSAGRHSASRLRRTGNRRRGGGDEADSAASSSSFQR